MGQKEADMELLNIFSKAGGMSETFGKIDKFTEERNALQKEIDTIIDTFGESSETAQKQCEKLVKRKNRLDFEIGRLKQKVKSNSSDARIAEMEEELAELEEKYQALRKQKKAYAGAYLDLSEDYVDGRITSPIGRQQNKLEKAGLKSGREAEKLFDKIADLKYELRKLKQMGGEVQ